MAEPGEACPLERVSLATATGPERDSCFVTYPAHQPLGISSHIAENLMKMEKRGYLNHIRTSHVMMPKDWSMFFLGIFIVLP